MSRWTKWWYHDRDGRAVFQHLRIPRTPTPDNPRDKECPYRYPRVIRDNKVVEWSWGKPPGADELIYRLPLVLGNSDATLVLTEGESDADALLGPHVALASCHHGGAGKFTEAQARSLVGHRGQIVLVADNDPAGAYDVCQRFDLLRAVGIPAKRLRVREVVPTHTGADLRDHLAAGHRLGDLRPADLARLREVASISSGDPSEGSWPAISDEEREDIRNWRARMWREPQR